MSLGGPVLSSSSRGKPKNEPITSFINSKSINDVKQAKLSISVESGEKLYEHSIEASTNSVKSLVSKQLKTTKKYQTSKINGKTLKEHVAFGVSLRKFMQYQQLKNPNLTIPVFLKDAFDFLMRKGLAVEGLFRKDGSKAELKLLTDTIDSGEYSVFEETEDIVLIGDVVKKYIQDLPEPIILSDFYDRFIAIDDLTQRPQQLDALRSIISLLPGVHQEVLQCLVVLFYQVSLNSAVNCMNVENLAIVFSPILTWRDKDANADVKNLVKEVNKVTRVVSLLIHEVNNIFVPHSEKLLEEKTGPRAPEFTKKLVGHHAAIDAIALTTDLSEVWSGDQLGTIRIWHPQCCVYKREIQLRRGIVFSMVSTVGRMWVATTNNLLILKSTGEIVKEHPGLYLCLVLHGENVWASGLNSITIFSSESLEPIKKNETSGKKISCLAISSELVWAASEQNILVWEFSTFKFVKEIKDAHAKAINKIIAVGNNVWSCSNDFSIKIWSPLSFSVIFQIPQAHGACEVLSLSCIGSHVWSGGMDKAIRVWESSTLELLHHLEAYHTDGIHRVVPLWVSKNRCLCWSASLDASLSVWETFYKSSE